MEGPVIASRLRLELAEGTVEGVLAGDGSRRRVRSRRRGEARRTSPRGVGGQENRRWFRDARFLQFRGLHLHAIRILWEREGGRRTPPGIRQRFDLRRGQRNENRRERSLC